MKVTQMIRIIVPQNQVNQNRKPAERGGSQYRIRWQSERQHLAVVPALSFRREHF